MADGATIFDDDDVTSLLQTGCVTIYGQVEIKVPSAPGQVAPVDIPPGQLRVVLSFPPSAQSVGTVIGDGIGGILILVSDNLSKN